MYLAFPAAPADRRGPLRRAGLLAHAGAPVVRERDLADPARQLAVRGDDQRAHVALVVLRPGLDRARRDERAPRPVPGERELALPLARESDVPGRRLALEC